MKMKRLLIIVAVLIPIFASATFPQGNIKYNLNRATNPTADQIDAYNRIKIAMDSAIGYYNKYTTITKSLNVSYNTSVATADASYSGSIRFGSNRSYMVVGTAMHEIAHTVGIGTTNNYKNLIVGGVFTGVNGTKKLKELDGPNAVLKGDQQHFWPYGINYASEVTSATILINHCKVVEAMLSDIFPKTFIARSIQSRRLNNSFYIANNTLFYSLESFSGVEFEIYTLSGKALAVREQGDRNAGDHSVRLFLPQGQYVCLFKAGGEVLSRRFFVSR